MTVNERYLVVVSMMEGRHFPKRNQHQLFIETKFDGETLSTDPVHHSESPEFNTELAWELDKKELHQHRLQRTPIKLQCYAVNVAMKTREIIGYIMLDLRTASQSVSSPANVPVPSKWYPLLSCKYQRMKPEIKVGLSLELDNKQPDSSFKAKSAPPRKGQSMSIQEEAESETFESLSMQAILNEAEKIFQIGPVDRCHELFIMSVTIAFATNLTKLIPSSWTLEGRKDDGFFFYYSLFGHDVTSEPFQDLLSPNFAAERAYVKIRSSEEALMLYFKGNPKLQVHFCCGNQSLGSCQISLASLLIPKTDQSPFVLEGSFQLYPPTLVHHQLLSSVSASMAPAVGVSVVLKREEIPLQFGATKPQTPQQYDRMEKDQAPSPDDSYTPPESTQVDDSSTVDEEYGNEKHMIEKGRRHQKKGQRNKEHESKTKESQERKSSIKALVQKNPKENVTTSDYNSSCQASSEQHFKSHINHHYCFSIDLRSIKDVDIQNVANIYLRYTYAFFGSSSAIQTHPPVEVQRHSEVLLPHSFCAFDFAAPAELVSQTFLRVPLLIEVWHRDKTTKDALVGVAKLPLSNILKSEKARIVNSSSGADVWRQISSSKQNVVSTNQQPRKVAELYVVLGLEDYGPIETQQIFMSKNESDSTSSILPHQPPPPQDPPPEQPDHKETQEYKAAIELEIWKEQQAGAFEYQLKEKELMYMQTLAEEWKKRDKDREIILKKKIEDFAQLENQLKLALTDIQKREQKLAANESEVARLRNDLQREQQQKLDEMKDASKRMKEDWDTLVKGIGTPDECAKWPSQSKVRLLENEKQQLAHQLAEVHRHLHDKQVELTEYKSQTITKPEVKLQSDINLLSLEKVEFERKLESVTKSKIHYKQQWGHALKELASLKQKEQMEAKARLRRQQQELEHMRLRYLASEEKEVVKSERQQLEEIKEELSK
ncbi:centrosomal protein of 120 kDa-like [Anneissia japonica]|uniref:centrosomal protein of 120 kDa-like n=1 Tax=Anneissia japonica TaxID=1529436 RepID=UPI0014258C96|nr:centrosomal protein of 120 kDa-like [Anneissia japonica]